MINKWALRTVLDEKERDKLNALRKKNEGCVSERALMILLNADGDTAPAIANKLHRNPHTVRSVIKAYHAKGPKGLERKYSTGRPAVRSLAIVPLLHEFLNRTPQDYGYPQQCWTKWLLIELCLKEKGVKASSATMIRALHEAGYSWKRPRKTTPQKAPSKAQKKAAVKDLIIEIQELANNDEAEIFMLDESHFSNEPHNLRGWFKRGEYFFPKHAKPSGKLHYFWSMELESTTFLLEKRVERKRKNIYGVCSSTQA